MEFTDSQKRSLSLDSLLDDLEMIPPENMKWLFTAASLDFPESYKLRRGRPPKHRQFPEIIKVVTECLSENAMGAHEKRHSCSAYDCGKTVRELREAIETKVPELKNKISDSTVRRLMLAPHTGRQASRVYHGLIDAKRPYRRNDKIEKENTDFPYTCSLINQLLDCAFGVFPTDCLVLSCDTMNKVAVGIPAVSSFHRPHGYSLVDRQPNLPDHTFPATDSCKLTPAGYMPMRLGPRSRRARSLSPHKPANIDRLRRRKSFSPTKRMISEHSFVDTSKRERINWPRTGELHIFLFAAKFFKLTSSRHAGNLLQILPQETTACNRRVVVIVTDGGPDWNNNSLMNVLVYGKLWMELRLDALILVRYAARYSKYNMIERRWAPLTRKLSQVVFPLRLPGEDQTPFQAGLKGSALEEKLKDIFDFAINSCTKMWRTIRHDKGRYPTIVHPVPSRSNDGLYNDSLHDEIHSYLQKANMSNVGARPDLIHELQFLTKHCTRTMYKLEFVRCSDPKCPHCTTLPPKTDFVEYLHRNGGFFLDPVLSDVHIPTRACPKRHYRTFIESLRAPTPLADVPLLDYYLPSRAESIHGQCSQGCRFVFFSAADEKRHNILIHYSQKKQ